VFAHGQHKDTDGEDLTSERKEHIDRKGRGMKNANGNRNFDRIYRINGNRMDRMQAPACLISMA
jgi:hypothetical protein